MKSFWEELKKLNGPKTKLPAKIDDATTPSSICEVWRKKFSEVLNSIDDRESVEELRNRLDVMEETPVHWTTSAEIEEIVKKLSTGKASGSDSIPSDFYKQASPYILTWISYFFNGLLAHQYVPREMSKVVMSPLLKSSLKDSCSSANYRPISLSTAASKILEHVIFNRIEHYVYTSEYQFGFKKKHGTDVCIFALKDVINYCRQLNTPVFYVLSMLKVHLTE